jgi:hypothetical protein
MKFKQIKVNCGDHSKLVIVRDDHKEKQTITKGPWAVGAPDGTGEADSGKQYNGKPYKEHCRVEARNRQGFIKNVCHIAQGEGGVGSPQALSEQHANARLIAAAPELLEALREMLAISLRVDDLAWAEAVGKGNGIGPCDKARQAIAKVEGEK